MKNSNLKKTLNITRIRQEGCNRRVQWQNVYSLIFSFHILEIGRGNYPDSGKSRYFAIITKKINMIRIFRTIFFYSVNLSTLRTLVIQKVLPDPNPFNSSFFPLFLVSRSNLSREKGGKGKGSDPASFFPPHGIHFSSLRSLAISLSFPLANLTVFHFFPIRCFTLIPYSTVSYHLHSGWNPPPHPSTITSPLSHAVFPSSLLSFWLHPSLLSTTKRPVRDLESMHRSNCSR